MMKYRRTTVSDLKFGAINISEYKREFKGIEIPRKKSKTYLNANKIRRK